MATSCSGGPEATTLPPSSPGKEAEVEKFLKSGLPTVRDEPATVAWFVFGMGPSTFGIFDAFPDDAGRNAHLSGGMAAALKSRRRQPCSKSHLGSEDRPAEQAEME